MMLPSVGGNRWVHAPCCWITSEGAIAAVAAANNRAQLAAVPRRRRAWWFVQIRALETVRALFL